MALSHPLASCAEENSAHQAVKRIFALIVQESGPQSALESVHILFGLLYVRIVAEHPMALKLLARSGKSGTKTSKSPYQRRCSRASSRFIASISIAHSFWDGTYD
jgi:hypothetical protein